MHRSEIRLKKKDTDWRQGKVDRNLWVPLQFFRALLHPKTKLENACWKLPPVLTAAVPLMKLKAGQINPLHTHTHTHAHTQSTHCNNMSGASAAAHAQTHRSTYTHKYTHTHLNGAAQTVHVFDTLVVLSGEGAVTVQRVSDELAGGVDGIDDGLGVVLKPCVWCVLRVRVCIL